MEDIEKLRAQAAALRAKNDAKAAALEAAEELARVRRELADEPIIEQLMDEHGTSLRVMRTNVGAFVTKRPSGPTMRKFIDRGGVEKPSTQACLELVRPVLLHPSVADFDAIIAKYPVVVVQLAHRVFDHGAAKVGDQEGKD